MDDLKPCLLGLSLGHPMLASGLHGCFELSEEALGVKPLLAVGALNSRAKRHSHVSLVIRSGQGFAQDFLLVLEEGNLVRSCSLLRSVQEVWAVLEQNAHALSRNMQNIPGIFVDVFLKAEDFLIARRRSKPVCHSARIFLKGLSVGIGVVLRLAKKERIDIGKVVNVKTLKKIRVSLIGSSGLPIKDGDVGLLLDAKGQVLEAVEVSSVSGGLAWTDALQGCHPLLGEDMVRAQDENIPLAPDILAQQPKKWHGHVGWHMRSEQPKSLQRQRCPCPVP